MRMRRLDFMAYQKLSYSIDDAINTPKIFIYIWNKV